MAIDFTKTFGQRSAQAQGRNAGEAASDRPKTQYWLNIGYETGDPTYPFVSLPVGIPLDGQERIKANGSNRQYAAFCAARNHMLDQLVAEAEKLEPGQDVIIGIEGSPFQMQLRRISEDREEASVGDDNPFARDFGFRDKAE